MPPNPVVWDDEYTGPRWTYGLTYRPLGVAQVPNGWIIKSDRSHPSFPHGIADWTRELTASEVEHAELTFVSHRPDGNSVVA